MNYCQTYTRQRNAAQGQLYPVPYSVQLTVRYSYGRTALVLSLVALAAAEDWRCTLCRGVSLSGVCRPNR